MSLSARGFTLIELLVVISIMAIIGVMAFANYNTLGQDQNLKAAASDVQALLRLAQANASARLKCGSDTTGSGADWIVSFETDKMTINLQCDIPLNPPPSPTPTPVLNKTLRLLNNIQVDSVIGCNLPVKLTFQPLLGGVVFDPCVSGSTMEVVLMDPSNPPATKTVIINKGGSIGIQ